MPTHTAAQNSGLNSKDMSPDLSWAVDRWQATPQSRALDGVAVYCRDQRGVRCCHDQLGDELCLLVWQALIAFPRVVRISLAHEGYVLEGQTPLASTMKCVCEMCVRVSVCLSA
jgi:hypothetical protein